MLNRKITKSGIHDKKRYGMLGFQYGTELVGSKSRFTKTFNEKVLIHLNSSNCVYREIFYPVYVTLNGIRSSDFLALTIVRFLKNVK